MGLMGVTVEAMLRKATVKAAAKLKKEKIRRPSDGNMVSVLHGDVFKDGNHWQVEYVYDTRWKDIPYIRAWVWVGGFGSGDANRYYMESTRKGERI